jgi:hypothetical protein
MELTELSRKILTVHNNTTLKRNYLLNLSHFGKFIVNQ